MVSAILLHYVIDDPLPTRGTFGDPGSNPGADNFFFFFFFGLYLSFSSTFLPLHKLLLYLVCTVASCYYILHITYQVEKKTKSGNVM